MCADRAGSCRSLRALFTWNRVARFVEPGDPVYEGMIVGEHNRENDYRRQSDQGGKKLTNLRAAGK